MNQNKQIFLGIYIIGYLLCYYIIKLWRNRNDKFNWEDVFISIFFSLFSWVMLLIIGVIILFESEKFKKPPKWL